MYFFFADREVMVRMLPSGLKLCEIGVQKGLFSKTLIATNPSELNLIDPWTHQEDELYLRDAANAPQEIQARNMAEVTATFEDDPRVKIHRGFSSDVLRRFSRGSLDSVYIDGNHAYQAVLDDLSAASSVVHDDGILMGHDFCSHWRSREGGFGVIGAVLEFCKSAKADLFGLTCSSGFTDHSASFSTYFISKSPSGSLKSRFLKNIFESRIGLIDLPLSVIGAYSHSIYRYDDGEVRYIPSFSQ